MRICLLAFLFSISHLASSQKFEFTAPIRLGSQINSSAEELSPILSPDGSVLYFARALCPANIGGELGGIDIWIAKKDPTGGWQNASNDAFKWNNKYDNAVIGINKNGTIIYLLNAYDRGSGISFSKLLNENWTEPERISIPGINQNDLNGCYMNPGFDVLVLSMNSKKSLGQEDLFVCLKDSLGKWNEPMNLGPTINTNGFEISPFLSKDGRMLYFSSNGHLGMGDSDIFVAERLYDSWTVWTKPRNLGGAINSEKFDSYFSIYGDTTCFFASNRSTDFLDVYQSNFVKQNLDTVSVFKDNITYFSQAEVKELFGKNPQDNLIFDGNLIDLNQNHKNILFELSRALLERKEISIRLITLKSTTTEELDQYQRRLLNILRYLKTIGIEGRRVTFGSETIKTLGNDPKKPIVIKFYK